MDLGVEFREGLWEKLKRLEVNIGKKEHSERKNTCEGPCGRNSRTSRRAKPGELDKYRQGSGVTLKDC